MILNLKDPMPKTPDELPVFLGNLQRDLNAASKVHEEALAEATRKIQEAHESVQKSEAERKILIERVENAEAIAKAAAEAGRSSNSNVEAQFRCLPQLRKVEKDEDWRGKIPQRHFNLLGMTREDARLYLNDEAFGLFQRFRRLNDMNLSLHYYMSMIHAADSPEGERYRREGGIKSLETYGALQETWKQFGRALDTATSGAISEWIPTLYSSERFTDTRDKLAFAGRLRWLPMPQSPWTMPTLLAFLTGYKIPESLADDNSGDTPFTASDVTAANRTLTAVKIATMSRWSRESEQDSIIALMPMLNEEIDYAQAYAIEQGVVNGQLASAVDTVSIGATDARKLWDGVRWAAKQAATQVDFNGAFTAELLVSMIGKMGKYAELDQCDFLTGYAGLARALILKDAGGNLLYMTRDRAGEAATLFNGTVGVLMGYPLTISGVYPQAMNASGVVDGAGGSTKTGILLVNKRPFVGGHRQGVQVETSIHEKFAYDQVSIRSTQRAAFKSLLVPSTSRPIVVEGVNIPTF